MKKTSEIICVKAYIIIILTTSEIYWVVQKYQGTGWILIKHTVVQLIYVNTSRSITCFTLIITPSKKRYRGVVISTENIYNSVSHLSISEIGSRGNSELRRRSLNYRDASNLYRAITRAIATVGIYVSSLIEIRPTYITFVVCLFLSFRSRFTYSTSMIRVILSQISRIFRDILRLSIHH